MLCVASLKLKQACFSLFRHNFVFFYSFPLLVVKYMVGLIQQEPTVTNWEMFKEFFRVSEGTIYLFIYLLTFLMATWRHILAN